MKQAILFNRYSLIALIVLLFLPFLYLAKQNVFTSYFDAFDKLSIPLWAALYSFFWLVFGREIKRLTRQITVLQNRVNVRPKGVNEQYRKQAIDDEQSLSNLILKLADSKIHFEFINISLRVTIILAAFVKIGQLVYAFL